MKVQVSVMKAMLALRRMNVGIIEFVPALLPTLGTYNGPTLEKIGPT